MDIFDLSCCRVCPRECCVDRHTVTGYCGCGDKMKISFADIHMWEEPCLVGPGGAGAVFFTGCPLQCVFCQNYQISGHGSWGREVSENELSNIIQELVSRGAVNIDFVSPTQYSPQLADYLRVNKPPVPVVWNTGGYEKKETIERLDGLVDIYLPDLKYHGRKVSDKYSSAEDYEVFALESLSEMYRQVGVPVYDENGIMKRGMLIRHLVLPGHTLMSFHILDIIAEKFPGVPVSLMGQYFPSGAVSESFCPEINRKLKYTEYMKVVRYMENLGLDGYVQELSSAKSDFVPDFLKKTGVNT